MFCLSQGFAKLLGCCFVVTKSETKVITFTLCSVTYLNLLPKSHIPVTNWFGSAPDRLMLEHWTSSVADTLSLPDLSKLKQRFPLFFCRSGAASGFFEKHEDDGFSSPTSCVIMEK